MIVVKYEEKTVDAATGAITYVPLGSESHQDIEEVLLPDSPRAANPIFFTKKFVGHLEYRWQVQEVLCQQGAAPLTYVVRLSRRPQIAKEFYLKNVLAARKQQVRRVLHPWAFVEVELGHSLTVGKSSGNIKGNKRYADTVQLYSMPKRRLAVVIQVIERSKEDLVQVIPISSRAPAPSDKAAVEVTSELSTMVNYQKRSWAICQMIQTVTASRVIAPLVQAKPGVRLRDKAFRAAVRDPVRTQLKDALMYGVASGNRVSDTAAIVAEKSITAQLSSRVAALESKMALYEKFVEWSELTMEDLQEMFSEESPAL